MFAIRGAKFNASKGQTPKQRRPEMRRIKGFRDLTRQTSVV